MNIFVILTIISALLLLCTMLEFLYSLAKKDGQYSLHGTLGNILRNMVTRALLKILEPLPLTFTLLALIGIGSGGDRSLDLTSLFASLVLIDFTYYFVHFAHHRWPLLWTLHFVHHSDNKFNLSTSMRVNWTQELYFTTVLITPAIVVGFGPVTLSAALFIFALYQNAVHAAYIRWPKFLERIFVTPRIHRVHHDQVELHQQSNFGGIFSLWDRLFGTYVDEIPSFTPGIKGYEQDNFIKMETDPIKEYFRIKSV